ncbi:transposase [Lactobacillus delbrueckii subsp. bulgaricus]|nr:transposase [Lactobacillus delbrueckii subsp. bulgaricus]MBT9004872.1 transposase [Lactobacillus delbrueckii subsp. bulgaricus]MBT9006120.1 transposase [Lactobacillus delbrueckii subsp. bulgaricus]MBT9007781.1 transposase [Lactobacillus delbrueckii subsp. bulgaricus]MBT9014478.1 transposase [Lactobacillus delbrueckii subsp. bulgaricus]
MYYNCLVNIPKNTGKISRNKRGKTTYIEYTYAREYLPEKKYNVARRTTIGKADPDHPGMMFPNPNFEKFFPDVEIPAEGTADEPVNESRSSCIRIGAFSVVRRIIEDYKLAEHLKRWDDRGKGLLLDLAAYSVIAESNVAQHFPDYAYNHPLMTPQNKIYSDSTISRFIREIDDNDRAEFLNSWNATHDKNEKIYVSYDSTNKNCKAGDIEMAEYGHPKNDVGAPIINYSIAYDMTNEKPLLYESYPGSIVDVSQLKYMLEKIRGYGYKKIGFILDRGYFSKANIQFMDSCDYDFVMMVKGRASFVHGLIMEHMGEFESKRACSIKAYRTYGMTVKAKLYADDDTDRYFHIYYKAKKQASERAILEADLDRMEAEMDKIKGREYKLPKRYEHYFKLTYHKGKFYGYEEREDVIERELQLCGYFAIVTSEKMTASEALNLYKSRDISEKLFGSDKTFLGNRSFRVASSQAAEAKIFIQFIALIIRARIYTLLRKRKAEMPGKPNYLSVPSALKELEKIELIRHPNGNYKLDHAVTATQKVILGAFGLDEEWIKAQARQIGKDIQNAAMPEEQKDDDEDAENEEY